MEMLHTKERKDADATREREEFVLQIEALKKDVCLEKETAAGLRKLCDELEAQASSHVSVDKQLRDVCEHRTSQAQKLEGFLSQAQKDVVTQKEKVEQLQAQIHQLELEILSRRNHEESIKEEVQEVRNEVTREKLENKGHTLEIERLTKENFEYRPSIERTQKLNDDLNMERAARQAMEQQCIELQELVRQKESMIRQLENSSASMRIGLRYAEDETHNIRNEIEMAKLELAHEKKQCAQFELNLEEQRTLILRMESAVEQAHVDSAKLKMELQQSQWDFKCLKEKTQRDKMEMEKMREQSMLLPENSQLEVERMKAELSLQKQKQTVLERQCENFELQLAAKVDIEAQFARVGEEQEEIVRQLEVDLKHAQADAMNQRVASVTTQTTLLSVQRELVLKCEALEAKTVSDASALADSSKNNDPKEHQQEVRHLRKHLDAFQNPKAEMQVELERIRTKLKDEEQHCQALLDLVMSSTQQLLSQTSPATSMVDRNVFEVKFKEAVGEIEKLLSRNVEQGTFIGEGEGMLDHLKTAIDSVAKHIEKAGEMQVALAEQLGQTLCQLEDEKKNSCVHLAEIDQLQAELEAFGLEARAHRSSIET